MKPIKGWAQQGWSGAVAPKPAVTEALRALQAAGLVTDRGALNGAWLELTS